MDLLYLCKKTVPRRAFNLNADNAPRGSLSFVQVCTTDADGYFQLEQLAAGFEYQVYLGQSITPSDPWFVIKVGAGETLDLGDMKAPRQARND